MVSYTTRLNASKPASSENVNVTTDLNNNFDLFDGAVGAMVGTSAARPASAFSGRLWYTSDTAKLYVNTASTASTAASWVDPVATAFSAGALAASAGLTLYRTAAASAALGVRVNADTQDRFQVTAGGSTSWGSGSATPDVNLYRSAANILTTDDSLTVGGSLTVAGSTVAAPVDTGWTNLTPVSGTGTMQYRCYDRTVFFRASLSSVTSIASGATGSIMAAGGIPAAYRPAVSVYSAGNGGGVSVTVAAFGTDGSITLQNTAAGAITVFRTAATWFKE